MTVPLQGLLKWTRVYYKLPLGSTVSLEERQGAGEVRVQGGCHPALGTLISLNTIPGSVADCGTFLFAPEDETC